MTRLLPEIKFGPGAHFYRRLLADEIQFDGDRVLGSLRSGRRFRGDDGRPNEVHGFLLAGNAFSRPVCLFSSSEQEIATHAFSAQFVRFPGSLSVLFIWPFLQVSRDCEDPCQF